MQDDNIPLTGLDHFFLALEKHNGKSKTIGNTCRYFLELDGVLTKEELKNKLKSDLLTTQLASYRLKERSIISGSFWVKDRFNDVEITEIGTDDKIPQSVLEYNIDITENKPYFTFFLLHRSNQTSTLVFCWHHLLMDGYGSCLYLSSLNQQIEAKLYTPSSAKFSFLAARKARCFVQKSAKPKLTSVFNDNYVIDSQPAVHIVDFTLNETESISANALACGAFFGQSTYYLASCAMAVKQLLEQKGRKVESFWVPVPQDKRKKLSTGPVLSNHLSLLFYRIENTLLHKGIHELTKDLTRQMKSQIKEGIPEKYNSLMHYLRLLPKSTYYRFIKGPHGGALSSFLFTVAPDHPESLASFMGRNVTDAMNIPPLTFPPGLTFAFAKYKTKTRIFVLYSTDACSKDEINNLAFELKELLLKREK